MGAARTKMRSPHRVVWLGLASLLIGLTGSGCGRNTAPAAALLRKPTIAHVYLAPLMSEHPLYEQYRRLEQEIAYLRRPCTAPEVTPLTLDLGELIIPGPEPPAFPLDDFNEQRREWQLTLIPERIPEVTELAPDLAALVEWERAQAEETRLAAMAAAEAEGNRLVAEARATAVRERQEALNNAGLNLNLTLPEREIEAAVAAERERLWKEIYAAEAAARAAADQRIASLAREVDAQASRDIASAEQQAWQSMQKRNQISVKSGSETKVSMSNSIAPPKAMPLERQVSWRPRLDMGSVRGLQPSLPQLAAQDQRLRAAQAARLAAERARLGSTIIDAVGLAAQRVAGLQGLSLVFPPTQRAEGRNVTERLRRPLREMFER